MEKWIIYDRASYEVISISEDISDITQLPMSQDFTNEKTWKHWEELGMVDWRETQS